MRVQVDDHGGTSGDGADRRLSTLSGEELAALVGTLEGRILSGTASLEDFGVLARCRRALAGRAPATPPGSPHGV